MNIVIQPFHDYHKWIIEGFRTRDAHLFEQMCKSNQVKKIIVINRPISLIERIIKHNKVKSKNFGEIVYKDRNSKITKINDKVFIIDYYSMDFLKVIIQKKKWWYTIFSKTNVQNKYKKLLKILNIEKYILFLQNPMSVSLFNALNSSKNYFDTIDNWLEHSQMNKNYELIEKCYSEVDESAQTIFSVSEHNKKIFNNKEKFFYLPNGVDIEYFSKEIITCSQKKDEKALVLGYVGKLQNRFDIELIKKVADHFTNEIKIFGPILSNNTEFKKVEKKYKNIKFLGDVSYDQLPKKMQEFDIALIPHKVDEFTKSMNPLKVYEYLAAGKQVVSTRVSGVSEISPYVYISDNHEEFLENIEFSLKQIQIEKIEPINISNTINKESTWESISERLLNQFLK